MYSVLSKKSELRNELIAVLLLSEVQEKNEEEDNA